MQLNITFKCTNKDCSEFRKMLSLQYYSLLGADTKEERAQVYLVNSPYCPKCHQKGSLSIIHGNKSFQNIDAFAEHLGGLAKEATLLKRIIDAKIGTEDENKGYLEVQDLITDVKCTCCGKSMNRIVE